MDSTGSSSGPAPAGRPDTASRGLSEDLLRLTGSLGRHFQALGALAGEEAREAGELALRLAVMLFAAVFFAVFGYVLAVICAAFLISAVFHISWLWILPVFVLAHVLLAFVCALHVRNNWRTPLFPATRGEIARDLDALSGNPKP